MYPTLTAALFTTAKIGKQTKCSSIDKENVVYIYMMEYYLAKEGTLPFMTTQIHLEGITVNEKVRY